MWLGDAIMEYMEIKEKYFTPAVSDMINDSFLGLSVFKISLSVFFCLQGVGYDYT